MMDALNRLRNDERFALTLLILPVLLASSALHGTVASLFLTIAGLVVLPGAVVVRTFSDLHREAALLLGIPVGAAIAGGLSTALALLSVLNPLLLGMCLFALCASLLLLRGGGSMEFVPSKMRALFVAALMIITAIWAYPHIVTEQREYITAYLITPENVTEGENFTLVVHLESSYREDVAIWLNLTYGNLTDNRSVRLGPGDAADVEYTLRANGNYGVRVDIYVNGEYYGSLSWRPLESR